MAVAQDSLARMVSKVFFGSGGIPARAGPGLGGAAGKYVVGNALVTWVNNGDRRGGVVA
jgi:hypothetical protein